MGVVAELLAHGGFLPQLAELNKKKTIFNKKNGVLLGVFWFMLFTMLLTSILAIANAPEEAVAITAVIGFFGSVMIVIASLAFLRSSKQFAPTSTQFPPSPSVHGIYGAQHNALPPQQTMPASGYAAPTAGSWRDTKDLQPASVTESTTKLLDKEERDQ